MVCNFYTTNNDIHEGTVTAHQILLQTAGKPALKAHKMFKQTLTVHEKPRLPRPSTCRTDEDVEKVIRIFTRSISKQLMISAAWHGAWKTGSFNRRICQAWLQWLYRNFLSKNSMALVLHTTIFPQDFLFPKMKIQFMGNILATLRKSKHKHWRQSNIPKIKLHRCFCLDYYINFNANYLAADHNFFFLFAHSVNFWVSLHILNLLTIITGLKHFKKIFKSLHTVVNVSTREYALMPWERPRS